MLCADKFGGQILIISLFYFILSVNKILGKGTFNSIKEQMTLFVIFRLVYFLQKLLVGGTNGSPLTKMGHLKQNAIYSFIPHTI